MGEALSNRVGQLLAIFDNVLSQAQNARNDVNDKMRASCYQQFKETVEVASTSSASYKTVMKNGIPQAVIVPGVTTYTTKVQDKAGTSFSIGLIAVDPVNIRKNFGYSVTILGVKVGWDYTFDETFGTRVELLPQVGVSQYDLCMAGAAAAQGATEQAMDAILNELKSLVNNAKAQIGVVQSIDQYFKFNTFQFGMGYQLLPTQSGNLNLNLDMTINNLALKVNNFAVGFDANVEQMLWDLIQAHVFNKYTVSSANDMLNRVLKVVPDQINQLTNTAANTFTNTKNDIQNRANTAANDAASKVTEFTNGVMNQIEDKCVNLVSGKGWIKDIRKAFQSACRKIF